MILFCKTRAIEIAGSFDIINPSVWQLIRVINYAHDLGRKKIIIVNCTSLSHDELLKELKNIIPEREKKRTIDRLETQLLDRPPQSLYSPTLFVAARSDTNIANTNLAPSRT